MTRRLVKGHALTFLHLSLRLSSLFVTLSSLNLCNSPESCLRSFCNPSMTTGRTRPRAHDGRAGGGGGDARRAAVHQDRRRRSSPAKASERGQTSLCTVNVRRTRQHRCRSSAVRRMPVLASRSPAHWSVQSCCHRARMASRSLIKPVKMRGVESNGCSAAPASWAFPPITLVCSSWRPTRRSVPTSANTFR